eukprot:TRINITY_DN12643_c0_g1_i12.p1 TRINITY_DN12643_c0_g1~~TRINITY_DN12643_c0_g1_i12.p1  ORF type:complete len:103 (-),score=12.91 TRINITY_DN12643_c0_g1_i12:43-351(-)
MVCVVALRNHSVVSWSFTSRQACIGADSHELDGHLARVAANCMSFLGCKNCPTSNPSPPSVGPLFRRMYRSNGCLDSPLLRQPANVQKDGSIEHVGAALASA